MEKKKRIISKLIFVLVLAAVVSMCFVGTTLARYVSSNGGSATTGVAKWDVEFGGDGYASNAYNMSFDKLSPSADAFNDGTVRSNVTGIKTITITNNSDVSARVYVTYDNSETYTAVVDSGWTVNSWGSDYSSDTHAPTSAPGETQVDGLFEMTMYYNTADLDALAPDSADAFATDYTELKTATAETAAGTDNNSYAVTLAPKTSVNIFVVVTWTSADEALDSAADVLDTWVGQNVASVAYNFTVNAYQASEQPTA